MPVWIEAYEFTVSYCAWTLRSLALRVISRLISCDCSDPVPVDSACAVMCSSFICLFRGHFLSACNGGGTVGRLWGIQVWFLLWKCFYNKGGQELRALQIYPFYCIIPPCHLRDSYSFEEIQQAFAKANKKPRMPKSVSLLWCLKCPSFCGLIGGLLGFPHHCPHISNSATLLGSRDIRLSF